MTTLEQETLRLATALDVSLVEPAMSGEPAFLPLHFATRTPLHALGATGPILLGNVYVGANDQLLGTIPVDLARARRNGAASPPSPPTRLTMPPVNVPSYAADEVAALLNEVYDAFVVADEKRVLTNIALYLEASIADDPRSLVNLVDILCRLEHRQKAATLLEQHGRVFHDLDDRDAVAQILRICDVHFTNDPWSIALRHDLTQAGATIYNLANIPPFDVLPGELTDAAEQRYPPFMCKGERALISAGETGSELVIVKSGYLKIYLRAGDPAPVRLRFAGDVVGEVRLLAAWRARQDGSAVVPSTAHVVPAPGTECWVLPETEIFSWQTDPSFPDFMAGLTRLSQRRSLDSYFASARWLRERLGRRPSQQDRNELIDCAGPPEQHPEADAVVVADGTAAKSILLVATGGLVEKGTKDGKLEYFEPGDVWGLGEIVLGGGRGLRRTVWTTQSTTLVPLNPSTTLLTRLRGPWASHAR